jgi:molybdate-binding protein
MVFSADDEGPYWMSPEEREQTRNNQYGTTIITKEYTKPQLIQLLERERGIVSPKGNKQKIQDMARQAGLPLTYEKREVIQGWEGKPKGMEQILWE